MEMAKKIGEFSRTEGPEGTTYFKGFVDSIFFKAAVTITPCKSNSKDEPNFVVCTDTGMEIGEGWTKKTSDQKYDYSVIMFDDPMFPRPIRAILVGEDKNGKYPLYWARNYISEDDVYKLYVTEELIPYLGVLRPIDKPTQYLIDIYPLFSWERGIEPDKFDLM